MSFFFLHSLELNNYDIRALAKPNKNQNVAGGLTPTKMVEPAKSAIRTAKTIITNDKFILSIFSFNSLNLFLKNTTKIKRKLNSPKTPVSDNTSKYVL